MKKFRVAALAASALVTVAGASSASAATILLNGLDSITNQGAKYGYKVAAKYWSNMLTNNATIKFDVAFNPLAEGVLGSTGSYRSDIHVLDVYDGMVNTAQSAIDAQAIASLTTQLLAGGGYAINANVTRASNGSGFFDTNRSYNNQFLYANTSVQKALGVTDYDGTDASITFSSEVLFDFDPSNGIDAGASDFVGVAIHEMGHALGFSSGVDYYDLLSCPNGPYCGAYSNTAIDNSSWMNVLDLFRYSSTGRVDWRVNTPSYFSIDNGTTEFGGNSNFSSGAYNGDGWQASHWQAPTVTTPDGTFYSCNKTNRIGIMNPYLCDGQGGDVKANDLAAFDAIGWNTKVNALTNPNYSASTGSIYEQYIGSVPEPSVWAMLILGFGLTGAAMRRKSKVQARFAF